MEDTSYKLHYQTYLDELLNSVRDCITEEGLPFPQAAQRVIAERLGFDLDDLRFTDGAGDRGIDFWYGAESGLYIFQVKTRQQKDRGLIDYETPFGNDGITDLSRARDFLLSSTVPDDVRLAEIKDAQDHLIRNHEAVGADNPVPVRLTLVILGKVLTKQAGIELEDFRNQLTEASVYKGVPLQFSVNLMILDDILQRAWREINHEWIDRDGHECKRIKLTPMKQAEKQHYLNDNRSAIFYCRALDLVQAYIALGYQIFEPNVRGHIRNSDVNLAIQESAKHPPSMKEFRFLNNGLTITCNSFKLPAGQRAAFEVERPGVVNGLQTVVALHDAYRSLPDYQKQVFEENCYVLVRLLQVDAVKQISDVVFATNNQNPMQRRNLQSNSAEQIHFVRFFAEKLKWFYEAKQGAWDAFTESSSRWRPQINVQSRAFKTKQGYKRIDNHDLARDWLSFLGFSDKATNEKKSLFDKSYYELIFLNRQRKHAYYNYQSIEAALSDSETTSPAPSIMLVAFLTRVFASKVVPSSHVNRKEALHRKGVAPNSRSLQEEEEILGKDEEYVLNQVLNTNSLIFVEFVGYCLFTALGHDVHRCGDVLLQTPSWNALYINFDWRSVVAVVADASDSLADDDLLVVLWLAFREAVDTLMKSAWRDAYRNDRYKSKFMLRNRGQLYDEVKEMDAALRRKVSMRVWTSGMNEKEGLFGYLRRTIMARWK